MGIGHKLPAGTCGFEIVLQIRQVLGARVKGGQRHDAMLSGFQGIMMI